VFSDGRHDRALQEVPAAPTRGTLRVLRGAAVGTTAIGLALAGHVSAGGALPGPTTAVALLALTVAGSVALSGRRWTGSSLFTVLLGVQVVFHVAFGSHPTATAPAGMTAHEHAGHSMSASMVLGHLLAASVTALLLSHGESWCWRLAALLGRPLQVARVLAEHSVPVGRVSCVPTTDGLLPVLRSLLLADAQSRRGPPALLAG
jgi:hypothetical protein